MTHPPVMPDDPWLPEFAAAKKSLKDVARMRQWRPWNGLLLLYGPSGTEKTLLAKECATEDGGTFLSVSCADLVSEGYIRSKDIVRGLFRTAKREKKPSIIFLDEVHSLCTATQVDRGFARGIMNEILMEGANTSVLILAATNTPWELEEEIRQRFERRIFIPLPDVQCRKRMFQLSVGETPHNITESDFQSLAERTEGFSGDEISIVAQHAFRRRRLATAEELIPRDLCMVDFETIIENTRPSVGIEVIQRHRKWAVGFDGEGRENHKWDWMCSGAHVEG